MNSASEGVAPSSTRAYSSWYAMMRRCTNPKSIGWKHYGGRGITVCERWRIFANFIADMGERPEGMSIDRIDNDGNYEPGNCRWATIIEQRHNQEGASRPKLNSVAVREIREAASRGVSQRQLARLYGVHQTTVGDVVMGKAWAHV